MKPSARIYRGTPRNLSYLAGRLRAGELVAVPTETVYGLAANAFDADACRRIFVAKGRPSTDPLIVHIHSRSELSGIAKSNFAAEMLADAFWPGPLTLVLRKQPSIPAVVSAGRQSVAVRMPSHPLFRRLIRRARLPLAAPSANPFGYVSPTSAGHVAQGLGHRVRHILDGGSSRIGLESTIVDLRNPRKPKLLRPGSITQAALERILGTRVPSPRPRGAPGGAQVAPGQLARHYSPHTPVTLHARIDPAAARATPSEAWVFLKRPRGLKGPAIHWLGVSGGLEAAGRSLFSVLRRLDGAGFRRIHVELAAGGGLAEAINDRLRRAARTDRTRRPSGASGPTIRKGPARSARGSRR